MGGCVVCSASLCPPKITLSPTTTTRDGRYAVREIPKRARIFALGSIFSTMALEVFLVVYDDVGGDQLLHGVEAEEVEFVNQLVNVPAGAGFASIRRLTDPRCRLLPLLLAVQALLEPAQPIASQEGGG